MGGLTLALSHRGSGIHMMGCILAGRSPVLSLPSLTAHSLEHFFSFSRMDRGVISGFGENNWYLLLFKEKWSRCPSVELMGPMVEMIRSIPQIYVMLKTLFFDPFYFIHQSNEKEMSINTKHKNTQQRKCSLEETNSSLRGWSDRQREGRSPFGNLLLECLQLGYISAQDVGSEVLLLISFLWQLALDLLGQLDQGIKVTGDSLELLTAETPSGHSRGTNTDTAG